MQARFALLTAAIGMAGIGNASAQAPAGASAIELAEQGYLHCDSPNVRRKTCHAITSFEQINDGVYNSTTMMAVGNGITMELYTPIWIVDGEMCGSIREQDVMTGTFRVNGRVIPPSNTGIARQQIVDQLAPFIDQEVCTRFDPAGADFVARNSIAGEYRAEWDSAVKVVSASDGYRVSR